MLYLDNNATTPVAAEVLEAMNPYWAEQFMNPSSLAANGHMQVVLNAAKTNIRRLMGSTNHEVFFTSGATEANNWILRSTVERKLQLFGRCNIVVSAIEHPSVLDTAKVLKKNHTNVHLSILPVDTNCYVTVEGIQKHVNSETDIVSIQYANNETGVIQPLEILGKLIKSLSPDCILHCDATQAVGKLPIDLDEDMPFVDAFSLSAHKINGPKGIGALLVLPEVRLMPMITGGQQQNGMRAGTECVSLIAGFAAACARVSALDKHEIWKRSIRRRTQFEEALNGGLGATIVASSATRLPNTTMILLPYLEGEMAVCQLLENGIVASTGAACSEGADTPSHVLLAMGLDYALARNSVRFSFGLEIDNNVREIAEKIIDVLK